MIRFLTLIVPLFGLGVFILGIFDERYRVPGQIERGQCYLRETAEDWYATSAGKHPERKAQNIVALFAQLNGGRQPEDTKRLVNEIRDRSISGLRVGTLCRELLIPHVGDVDAANAKNDEMARAWLRARDADVLVWGEVTGAHEYRLRITSLGTSLREGNVALEGKDLVVPIKWVSEFAEVIAITVLASVSSETESEGRAVVAALEPHMERLRALAENTALPPEQRTAAVRAYRNALFLLGEQSSDPRWIEEAERFNRESRDGEGAATAMAYRALALLTLGERSGDAAKLEEAVRLFRQLLTIWTRRDAPLNWATTQNNLGNALSTLGERESGTARLEAAVAAYREALKERTRERVPLQWAMTQNNLGAALWTLGERESGTARLEEAVAAYREALKERTRERVPLQWAGTQYNLSITLVALHKRTGNRNFLTEALTCIDGALEVYRAGNVSYWIPRAEAQRVEIIAAMK